MSDWVWWEQFTWGFRTRQSTGGDVIKVVQVTEGNPNEIRFDLTTVPPVNWRKTIQVVDTPVWFGLAMTNESDRGPASLVIPAIPVFVESAALEFTKAAFFGIQSGFYKVGDLFRYRGKIVVLEWRWDWGGDERDGYKVPAASPPVPGA